MGKRVLEKVALRSRRTIGIRGLEIRRDKYAFTEDVAEDMVLELSGYVWAEQIEEKVEHVRFKKDVSFSISLPDGWWQHTRARWFPRWWLRRFPVRLRQWGETKTVTDEKIVRFRTMAMLPEFNYEAPRGCGVHVIRTMDPEGMFR